MPTPAACHLRTGSLSARLAGVLALLLAAWVCMYGKIWSFEKFEAHRFTAKAMLTGTLRLRGMVTLAGHDEQVYNGAVYTNWGFGVPLLQVPFHAFAGATHMAQGFFPDRAIYFLYLALAMPVLWAAFDRLLGVRWGTAAAPGQRLAASWAATWMVLNVTLFPFMSTRFVIYEETLAYMTLCELLALSAYIFARGSWDFGPVCAMGIAAGMGLLVRPIGLLYVITWAALVALEGRTKRVLLFASVVAPFLGFWLYGNAVRSGSILGLGYANSNPAWEYETPLLRFGTTCCDSPWHVVEAAGRLFGAFFFYIWRTPHDLWLKTCHFDFEERDGAGDPFFGPGVLVLLAGMAYGLVARYRERRLSLYVPYAAMALLFAAFVRRGEGFAWRYVGDFWPLIVLATVQYVYGLPPQDQRPLDARLAKIMFWAGFVAMARFLVPWEWASRADILEPHGDFNTAHGSVTLAADFAESRWGIDPPMPPKVSCEDHPRRPFHNGLGWLEGCRTGPFTNVYLGVPPKTSDGYALRIATEGMSAPAVVVYFNGKIYSAEKHGDSYEAEVNVHYAALGSPIVLTTVLWGRGTEGPPGKLLSIELV
jgi:hypothetical protein